MSNKTQLQQNNLDLSAVLEHAQKLEGHGQYVWKKSEVSGEVHTFLGYVLSNDETAYPDGGMKDGYYYERDGGKYVWEKQTQNGYLPATITAKRQNGGNWLTYFLNSTDVDIAKITNADLMGMRITNKVNNGYPKLEVTNESKCHYEFSSSSIEDVAWTWNPPVKEFAIITTLAGAYDNADWNVEHNIPSQIPKYDTIGYVISDDPNKYPEDGEQDGKYYSKVHPALRGMLVNEIDSAGNFVDVSIKFDMINSAQFDFASYKSKMSNIKKISIITGKMEYSAFKGLANHNVNCKVKLKALPGSTGGENMFSSSKGRFWISKNLVSIAASMRMDGMFYGSVASEIKVYSDALSKPSGWDSMWNASDGSGGRVTVVWGVTEEQFDAMQ